MLGVSEDAAVTHPDRDSDAKALHDISRLIERQAHETADSRSLLVWSADGKDGDKPMKITRKDVLVAIITNAVLLLGIHATEAEQASPPLSSAQIIEILSSPD